MVRKLLNIVCGIAAFYIFVRIGLEIADMERQRLDVVGYFGRVGYGRYWIVNAHARPYR